MFIDPTKPVPLYQQVADHIREQIESSELEPGDRLGSHNELMAKYGVSLITIRKALSELIRLRYIYSQMGKGSYVLPRNSRKNFSNQINIGLVLRNLNSPYFSRIAESIERYATEHGVNLLIATSANSVENETQQIRKYLDLGVSGLILTTVTSSVHVSEFVKNLHKTDFPYVIVSYIEDEDINYVGIDQEYGGYLATSHLIGRGRTRIAYINSEEGYSLGELRKSGYLKALQEYGIAYEEKYHFRLRSRGGWNDYEGGYEIGQEVSKMTVKPDGLFAYNDLVAVGFQRALIDKGWTLPEDISIVGFDNIKRGVVCPVPLTTVDQRTDEIGPAAIEMVLNQIKGIKSNRRIIKKPKLIIRRSCGELYDNFHLEKVQSSFLMAAD